MVFKEANNNIFVKSVSESSLEASGWIPMR